MHQKTVGNATVHYRTEGQGPGLLLVHGTGATGETNYGHLLKHFTEHHTVIAPDYAGSGDTVDDGADLALDQLVDQVLGACDDVTDEPVDIVGFSLGAVIAAAAAARHPERVRRLVLVAGWARNDDLRKRLGFQLWRRLADVDPELYSHYISLLLFTPGFLADLDEETFTSSVGGIEVSEGTLRQIELGLDVDIRDLLPRVTAPTLVVGCRHDQLVPVQHSRELHEAIADSTYLEIESGHLVPAEAPDELVDAIQKFLS
ncbi:alpha/beta hydrolase [Streptomyces sp. NBC_01352]|uniref:Alpha/beta fold hydrolase n=1 Tax=Streptomyces plumbiresistens TaxID=511811 RepID=A0ABP7TSS9_9ACTN|nr:MULTISPECIES: alpha/beta hydrolase [unclassified Streptomyces]MCX4698837.1 alpha/beta hydrolase [Streptomyces sp. NBC_01373]